MKKTWMPTAAGILDIVCGAFALIGSFGCVVGGGIVSLVQEVPRFVPALTMAMALPLLIVGILAIVGGVYALKRAKWGLALTGSIVALFPSWPLGIAAIVFTVLAKNEFE